MNDETVMLGVPPPAPEFPGIASIELLIADLDAAVALFCDVLGCGLLARGPAGLIAGEQAIIDVGTMTVTLLAAADSGEPVVLPDRTPRLASIELATSSAADTAVRCLRAMEAGLIVATGRRDEVVLPPEAIEGAIGWRVGIVLAAAHAGDGGSSGEL